MSRVNLVATALAERPGEAGVRLALERLENAGIRATLLGTDTKPENGAIALCARGRVVGSLELPADVPPAEAESLASLFALAVAPPPVVDAVLEAVADGVLVLTEHEMLSANPAARRMLSIGDELPSLDSFGVRSLDGTPIAPEDYPVARALATGEPQPYRLRVRIDESERIFDGVVSRLSPGTAVTTFRDVTDEHERGHLAERLLESLVESIPTAVMVSEAGTFRVLSANGAMRCLVGDADPIVGAVPPYPWWAEPPATPVETWLHDGSERWEQLYRRADGSLVPVEGVTFTLHGSTGEAERIVSLVTDLSERRRLDQQLVQSSKLASIGELAAGVAHEINNPLFAILGLAEFLLREVEPATKAHERVQLVQQTGLEIKEIVRALLDFARERSDEFSLVSLENVARQTLDLVRKATSAKGVELVERYPAEDTPVNASANQLKQVLLNLLTNAQHALPDGGTIVVEVARDGDWVTATVSDTGPGIDAEILPSIFDPFFTTKRDRGGTGLGLSVSLGIAEMHGGDLTVESEPGRGASFVLRVPLAK